MRSLIRGLIVIAVLTAAAPPARALCGDKPGDVAAVRAVVAAVLARCDCCGSQLPQPGTRPVSCAYRVVVAAVRGGTLPRRCARTALRRAARACRLSCPLRCELATQCDDGNPCTTDACVSGRCTHACECFGPAGEVACCPGPAAECPVPSAFRYFRTCGYPVCPVDDRPIPGVPACTTQRAGDPCTTPGEECDPGAGCGVRLLCTDRNPAVLCPISERKAKRDIAYLTPADIQRVHNELMQLPLATYAYRSEASSARSHLGFIIDDVGESPAVGQDGTTVDLDGYASMAVAALQAQGKEIDQLKKEVDSLRNECRTRETPTRRPAR